MSKPVALITGAAAGIGRAIAERLAADGFALAVLDREPSGLPGAYEVIYDLSDAAKLNALVDRIERDLGPVEALVNNAGVVSSKPLLDVTLEDWERTININARAPFFLMQACGRRMVQRRHGAIVNIASVSGRLPKPMQSVYGVSKAAIIHMTRSAAAAFGPHGVRVTAVSPGVIDTPLTQSLFAGRSDEANAQLMRQVPLGRIAEPREIAAVVSFLLGPDSSYVNGQTISACGGLEMS